MSQTFAKEKHNMSSLFEWFVSSVPIGPVADKRGRWECPLPPEDCSCEQAAQRGRRSDFRSRCPSSPVPAAVQRRRSGVTGAPPTGNARPCLPAWGVCECVSVNQTKQTWVGATQINSQWDGSEHWDGFSEQPWEFPPSVHRVRIQTVLLLQRSPPASCLQPTHTTGRSARWDRWLIASFLKRVAMQWSWLWLKIVNVSILHNWMMSQTGKSVVIAFLKSSS